MPTFQRYRSNTPGTLHAGLAPTWNHSLLELSSSVRPTAPGQPTCAGQGCSDRSAQRERGRGTPPSPALPSASPRRGGGRKKHREKVKVPATPRGAVDAQVFLPDRWWEGEERGGGRKGTSSRRESEIGKLPAQPSALGDKNTRLAVTGSVEGPATGAKADAHDALLRVPPRAVS